MAGGYGIAITGAGLGMSAGSGSAFIGGATSRSNTGATLEDISYRFTYSSTQTLVNRIDLRFAGDGADGRRPVVAPSGGGGGTFLCSSVTDGAASCGFVPAQDEAGYRGLDGVSVTVY
jgi:hypothetical protein